MKRACSCLLLAALLLSLCGCAGDKQAYVPTGDALVMPGSETTPAEATSPEAEQPVALAYYPDRPLNPYQCADYTNRVPLSLVYQGLFAVSRNYEAFPILCDRYAVSEDLYTYIFYLADARFSDGSAVTAQDVVASYDAAQESSMYGGRFFNINEVSATDDGGVRFDLDTPYENLPLLLDIPIVKASEVASALPLGTGPYAFDSSTGSLRLRRVSGWWCKSDDLVAKVSAISLIQAESTTQLRDQFQFGDLSLVCTDPGTDAYADYLCDTELWECEGGLMLYLVCNQESESMGDDRLRTTLTYAIDRDAIIAEFYRGFARSATLPASPQSPYYNSALAANYTYDPERFNKAVTNAGLVGTKVTLLVSGGDSLRLRVAKEIAEMIGESGLEVEIKSVSNSDDFYYLLAIGEYDLYLAQTKLSVTMDLSQFFFEYASLCYGYIDDAGTYAQCEESLANQGNFYNLHKKIMDDGSICPLLFRSYAVYAKRGVFTGLNPARDNVFFYTRGLRLQDIQVPME